MDRKFQIGDLVKVTREGIKQNWNVQVIGYARNNYYVLGFIDNKTTFQANESELSNA